MALPASMIRIAMEDLAKIGTTGGNKYMLCLDAHRNARNAVLCHVVICRLLLSKNFSRRP
ncbi:hypothetical protein ACHAWX_006396 [Stephanocyclus meneghinianus]